MTKEILYPSCLGSLEQFSGIRKLAQYIRYLHVFKTFILVFPLRFHSLTALKKAYRFQRGIMINLLKEGQALTFVSVPFHLNPTLVNNQKILHSG